MCVSVSQLQIIDVHNEIRMSTLIPSQNIVVIVMNKLFWCVRSLNFKAITHKKSYLVIIICRNVKWFQTETIT